MLDLVQTLAILKLFKNRNNQESPNSGFGGFIIIVMVLICLPILFYGFPLVYLLIYCPYKFLKRDKTKSSQALDNFTFFKYLVAIALICLILVLFLVKVLLFEVAITLLAFIFYVFMTINFILDLHLISTTNTE